MKLKPIIENMNTRQFGKELKKILSTNSAYAILDNEPEATGSSFLAGGCYALAAALLELMPGAELWGVFRDGGVGIDGKADHFALKVGDIFIDGDGAQDERQMIRTWTRREFLNDPVLKRASKSDIHSMTPHGSSLIRKIKDRLESEVSTNKEFGKMFYRVMSGD